jgi:hypothetical protein
MPNSDAKPLGYYPQHYIKALDKARSAPDTWIVVENELNQKEARSTYIKLTAMRAGLRQFEPAGSELKEAAMTKRIHISNPSVKHGELRKVMIKVDSRLLRPSEQAAQSLADFAAGLRSTPF